MNAPTKHTPGPWVVDLDGVDYKENMAHSILHPLDDKDEWMAVGLEDEEGYESSVAYCHPNNARLIAAAPDLLEALVRLSEHAEEHGSVAGWSALFDQARDAISKATGS